MLHTQSPKTPRAHPLHSSLFARRQPSMVVPTPRAARVRFNAKALPQHSTSPTLAFDGAAERVMHELELVARQTEQIMVETERKVEESAESAAPAQAMMQEQLQHFQQAAEAMERKLADIQRQRSPAPQPQPRLVPLSAHQRRKDPPMPAKEHLNRVAARPLSRHELDARLKKVHDRTAQLAEGLEHRRKHETAHMLPKLELHPRKKKKTDQ